MIAVTNPGIQQVQLSNFVIEIPPNKHTVCITFEFVLLSLEKSVDPDQLVSNSVS